MARTMEIRAAGATNQGPVRDHNEDSLLVSFPFFLVADGMGGHRAGDVASRTVISVFAEAPSEGLRPSDVPQLVTRAQERTASIGGGAGSTLSGVIALRNEAGQWKWMVLNVGDSRVYRYWAGKIIRLTWDHSEAEELWRAGAITEQQAMDYPRKNIITRALGDGDSDADYALTTIMPGERLLVCSDGLSGVLDHHQLAAALGAETSVEQIAGNLIDAALNHKTRDNVTAIVVEAGEPELDAETAPASVVPWYPGENNVF